MRLESLSTWITVTAKVSPTLAVSISEIPAALILDLGIRPVTPSDLAATIYTLLGIDPKLELHTADGRPVRVAPFEAEAVRELV